MELLQTRPLTTCILRRGDSSYSNGGSVWHRSQQSQKPFFAACETGKGWDVCSAYCTLDATFSAQAEPLLDVTTLAQYTDWMKDIMTALPDAHYEVRSFAMDAARNNVAAYGVFHATHTGPGGPVPPTGRHTSTDYVYVMQFDGDKVIHMPKPGTPASR